MIQRFIKSPYPIFVFLTIIFCTVYKIWLFDFSIISRGDWGFYFVESLSTLRASYFSLWLSDNTFGRVLIDVGQAPTYALAGNIAKFFELKWNLIERLVYFLPIVIVTPVTTYLLMKDIFKSKWAFFTGIIVYCFNTYFLVLQTGHLTLMTAFAFLPLAFLTFKHSIEYKTLRHSVMAGLSLSICSFYEPRAAYILIWLLAMYTLFNFAYNLKSLTRSSLLNTLLYAAYPIIVFVLLNIFWLLGLYNVQSLTQDSILVRGLWGSHYFDVFKALTLFHPWWSGTEVTVFYNQEIPWYFYFIPFFAFCGFIVQIKKPIVTFAAIVAIIGIFLAKQEAAPIGNLYYWLFSNVPGFNAYREASKFYSLIVFSYTILIAAFIEWLWFNKSLTIVKNAGKFMVSIFVVTIFLLNTQPLISKDIKTLFVSRQIPEDYLIYKKFILDQETFFRILGIPIYPRWGIYTDQHPQVAATSLSGNLWSKFTDSRFSVEEPHLQIVDIFSKPFSDILLDLSTIKYVIIPLQDYDNDDNFFLDYGGMWDPEIRNWYIEEIDKLDYLKRIDIGTNNLVVFENTNYRPYLSSLDSILKFESTNNFEYKYNFVGAQNLGRFDFTISDSEKHVLSKSVINTFENLTTSDISGNQIFINLDTRYKVSLFSPGDNNKHVYDALTSTLSIVGESKLQSTSTMHVIPVAGSRVLRVVYENEKPFVNSIDNASFENGLWQSEVGDCNHYDSNQKLSMGLEVINPSTGKNSLRLSAIRHTACTATKVAIKPNQKYLLSFDYRSDNASEAGYYIGYNDSKQTALADRIPIKDQNWGTFTKIISTPEDVTLADVYVYSYEKNGLENIHTYYDNFYLVELPNDILSYWLIDDPQVNYLRPENVSFEFINPTRKSVSISSATTPFYLTMSESYHPQWRAELNNKKSNGTFSSWIPWVHPDKIQDDYHFKLDGFLNGWYVDPFELCGAKGILKEGCTMNEDGSYNIELIIEFTPQRWFYVGLIISGTTLLGCFIYLGYDFVRRRRRNIS